MAVMKAAHAAEDYIRGFYCRSDGVDRDWAEYRGLELAALIPVFRGMEENGCTFKSVGHLYTTSMGVTAVIEVQFAAIDILEQLETPREAGHWFNTFLNELRGEQGNKVMMDRDWASPNWMTMKIIVSESC